MYLALLQADLNYEKAGLVGVLALAVAMLWRRLDQKNSQIETLLTLCRDQVSATEAMAQALHDLREEVRFQREN